MINSLEKIERDLEFILTEWEGKSNPLMGAFRVKARKEKIMPLFHSLLAEIEKDHKKEVQRLKKIANGYAKVIATMADGVPYEKAILLHPSEPRGEEKP